MNNSIRRVALLFGLLLGLLSAMTAQADERILNYHADVQIEDDGGMLVTETITVNAEGDQIKRGIYRDFPTTYKTPAGHRYKVIFEFLDAERDSATEEWRDEAQSNGMRVYLGSSDSMLPPGEHTYVLRFRTNRQLGFFDEHDELYWNVTGNGWAFPIDQASAELHLPEAVRESQLKAFGYTGPQGSMDANLTAEPFDGGASYKTTQGLGPQEGLSAVLEFPKGVITPPSREQQIRWLLADNLHLLIGLAGLIVLLGYYGLMWSVYGRDPAAGVRIPLYEPPNGFSPASLRYIRRMGYDKTCFAAALLGLAAKGWLIIEQDDDKQITLRKTGKKVDFAPGEKVLTDKLFATGSTVVLKQSIHKQMQATLAAHKNSLSADYEKKYFFTHKGKWATGMLIAIVSVIAALISLPGEAKGVALFLCVWLSLWSIGVYTLVSQAINATRGASGVMGRLGAGFLWLFALPFIAGELTGFGFLAATTGFGFIAVFAVLVGTVIGFYHWMKAPTQDGARLLDKIEGFRWYLGVAEKQELDSRYKPESKPELFSEYLPYALALDVEQEWAERFTEALSTEEIEQARPGWYHGSSAFSAGSLTALAGGIGAGVGAAIAASSTSPGSSSGGGGGGSGGGGGGGGGGGW